MQLLESLKTEKEIRKEIEKNGGYGYMSKGNHLKAVFDLNRQYRKENPSAYGYNAAIVDYIMEKENIPEDLKDILGTQVYFSQKDIERKKIEKYESKMLSEGWLKLTKELIQKALDEKKKILLSATHTNDWATSKVNKTLKPHLFNGEYGLMELRARSKGYSLNQFDNAFCKIID